MNKRKIINDPVYGFISIPSELIYDLIEHPWFQRLRRIKQLGMAEFVYPGALHTRFHHALGAMHLMDQALHTLEQKGHMIWQPEREAALCAILLHDIGHGPFSHVMESVILKSVHHEHISFLLMNEMNKEMGGRLEMAIQMFSGNYPRKFFHQLISSQLDMDRLDYLNRDSFYSGVAEGTVGADRIIKMLDVSKDQLVVEEKGILSIENFLNARRLMYWQVYLHKTAHCAENMLLLIIKRARELMHAGEPLFATSSLRLFLIQQPDLQTMKENRELLRLFTSLDDYDIIASIKEWALSTDPILCTLSRMLLNRKLFKIRFYKDEPGKSEIEEIKNEMRANGIPESYLEYLVISGKSTNSAYVTNKEPIKIKMKNGQLLDIADASDLPAIKALSKIVTKFYICWAKNVSLRE